MSEPDLKTSAFVLRRTNYGETDRILNLLTPEGKIACLAKGVRKERSKLAGGIEMFCLSQVVVHRGRSDLYTLTSAKMERFYSGILADLSRLELASEIIKQISRLADQIDSPEYFELLRQCLEALDDGASPELIETWFNFNFARIRGDQINLVSDVRGNPLDPAEHYVWDSTEEALKPLPEGKIGVDEIKLMRLMLSAPLALVLRVKNLAPLLPSIHPLSQAMV